MNKQTWLHGTLAAAALVFTQIGLAESAHGQVPPPQESWHDGPWGSWVVLPENSGQEDGNVIVYGSCAFDMGLPGDFTARLGGHGYPTRIAPDHAWADAAGNGWERFHQQVAARQPMITVQLICGTGYNTDIEFFYPPWAPIGLSESPQFDCPAHKPWLMAARCQTHAWWF